MLPILKAADRPAHGTVDVVQPVYGQVAPAPDDVDGAPEPAARVLVAAGQAASRVALRACVVDDPTLCLVGEADSGPKTLSLVQTRCPDLVLIDIDSPAFGGLETTRAVRRTWPATRVLVVSAHAEVQRLIDALTAGAAGYVLRTGTAADVRHAIAEALADALPVDDRLAQQAVRHLSASFGPEPESPGAHRQRDTDIVALSTREREVLELLACGHSNREIAEALVVTPHTVKVHVEHILAKLGASTRTQAVVRAIELGAISPDILRRPVES